MIQWEIHKCLLNDLMLVGSSDVVHIGSYCKETSIGVMHCNSQWKNSGGCVLFTIYISDIVEEEARRQVCINTKLSKLKQRY